MYNMAYIAIEHHRKRELSGLIARALGESTELPQLGNTCKTLMEFPRSLFSSVCFHIGTISISSGTQNKLAFFFHSTFMAT